MNASSPLRVFVAMPGTDMGSHATYKNPESVKNNLLKPAVDKLKAKLGREVTLVIEKDKIKSGDIHKSMFSEASYAEVYLADLTGANPNVYLELGVRWSLRDRVTILIAQSIEDLKFNVDKNRVILYNPDNVADAIENIVNAIQLGLNSDESDSPVRGEGKIISIPKSELDDIRAEIQRLTKARGEDLLHSARATETLSDRITLLRQAVDANPVAVEAMLELGKAYRDGSEYEESARILQAAQRLNPTNAVVNRELGVTYSKQKELALAAVHLREAVRLAPNDAEAWSNLGGALRRLGMAKAPGSLDEKALEEARNSYDRAHTINEYDLYSGLNVARLNLLLSKWDSQLFDHAKQGFARQVYLCHHKVQQDPNDYWRLFDLADAQLFSGEYAGARTTFNQAIGLIPVDERKDKLLSVLGPLQDYLTADVLNEPLKTQVEEIVKTLESARAAP